MPVGWGEAPIQEILSILLPTYQGMLMMELRSRYFNFIQESRDNLSSIIPSIALDPSVDEVQAAVDVVDVVGR